MTPSAGGVADLESTAVLLERVRGGDEAAIRRLVELYRPLLQRWAHGRLPGHARGLMETGDLVQVSLLRVLKQVGGFDARRPGAFLAYLRRTFLNQMRNAIRDAGRRPRGEPVSEVHPDAGPSPVEEAIGREALERYERSLMLLTEDQQAAVILRVEMGRTHREIAGILGCPSANAARMLVSRGVARLAELMQPNGGAGGTG